MSMFSWIKELPCDIKVTRVVGFDLVSRRPKFVGKNSRLDDHGDHAVDPMVRVFTNTGIEGLGRCHALEADVSALLGRNLHDLFERDGHSLGAATMPLWDLAGKAMGKPVYALLGGRGPERVPAYDGSIYFTDLQTEYADRWQDRLREEVAIGMARGHRAFKVKVGRGAKWMRREDGDRRDREVLRFLREHVGPDILLGIDANNGYDLERTQRLTADLKDLDLAFVEEMFPEDIEACRALKAFLNEHGIRALIADGETQGTLDPFWPLMEARAVDVFQGDMNHFGIEGIFTEATWARGHGLKVAPHNWGSLVGFVMILHVARAIANFYMAEHDPLDTDVLVMDGYTLDGGYATVPDAPGFGLSVNEKRFAAAVTPKFDLKA